MYVKLTYAHSTLHRLWTRDGISYAGDRGICIYMYVCIYIYIYIHICMYVRKAYIRTFNIAQTVDEGWKLVCRRSGYLYIYIYTYIHTYIYIYTDTCT